MPKPEARKVIRGCRVPGSAFGFRASGFFRHSCFGIRAYLPMVLRLLTPGLCTMLVDFGRPASRSLGVPVGGAADRWSLALGNGLVGNPPDTAALEINLAGPTLRADVELACVL